MSVAATIFDIMALVLDMHIKCCSQQVLRRFMLMRALEQASRMSVLTLNLLVHHKFTIRL